MLPLIIWLSLAGAVAFLMWYNFIKPLDHFKKMGVTQSNSWPILGDQWSTILRLKTFGDVLSSVYNKYTKNRYVGLYQFSTPVLLLRDPQLIREITVKAFDHFSDHVFMVDEETDPLWHNNLFALKGQKWREMRATLSGSFTSSKMKHMFTIINEAAENFAQYFLDRKEDLIKLDMKDTFTRYTNDVIATAAFGIKVNSLAEPNNYFYNMGKKVTDMTSIFVKLKLILFFMLPRIFKLFKLSIFSREGARYFSKIIYETIQAREEKGIVRKDMINLLLEVKKGNKNEEEDAVETGFATATESTQLDKYKFKQLKNLTNDDIVSQSLIFFLAGFETVSLGLCFGSYELAVNKDIQDRLRREIQETHKANNGKLTYDVLLKMKYMDMVFTEILRKWPLLYGIDRVCTKPYTIEPVYADEKPVHLKVGDFLFYSMYAMHRYPKYYADPEKFDPERFSDANKDSIRPYTYLPFGSGPRNCIGSRFAILESKIVLYHLLLHFEIVPTEQTRIPLKLSSKTLQPSAQGGYWLGLKRIRT